MKKSKKIGLIFSACLLGMCGAFGGVTASANQPWTDGLPVVRPWMQGEHQLTKAQFGQFVQQLNADQKNVVRNSLIDCAHSESSYLVDAEIPEADGADLIAVNKLGFLVDAIDFADLDLVQRVYSTFQFTGDELNECDILGRGTPLWSAVCLADRYAGTENEGKVIGIVNFLLDNGANPYADVSKKGYIPRLFDMGDALESRIFLEPIFEMHGYDVLPDGCSWCSGRQ